MKNRYVHAAFIGLLGLVLSTSLFAQGRELAAQRKIIQARQKAAIALENAHFKLDTIRLRENAKSATDSNAKNLARMKADAARRNHDAELKRIRAQAQAALNALRK
jgi:hypothetical protein